MILARRMKLVLLTTNQTLIFVSVLEVSGNPLKERQKNNSTRGKYLSLGKCHEQMKRVD